MPRPEDRGGIAACIGREGQQQRLIGRQKIENADKKSRFGGGGAKIADFEPREAHETFERRRIGRDIAQNLNGERLGAFLGGFPRTGGLAGIRPITAILHIGDFPFVNFYPLSLAVMIGWLESQGGPPSARVEVGLRWKKLS